MLIKNLNNFSRTELLIGEKSLKILEKSNVAVFGIGGVGSFTAEALARSGVGRLSLFDGDIVSATNINRQLIATVKTIGRDKVEVMRGRISDINPAAEIRAYKCFYAADNAENYDFSEFSYIADAIDTVSSKLLLIERAKKANVPVISSMGAGNKLDPTMFEVTDIYKTSVCPLARVMRRELRLRGIAELKVVYSKEQPISVKNSGADYEETKRQTPGSIAFVPSVAGLIIAGEIIKDLISKENE